MHYKISEVTHMSIEQLDTEGEDFVRAMTEFLEWCGDDYRFCTWGSMDLTELQRNMVYHGMELQFPSPLLYYDLQKIYALIHGTKQKESLDTVVEELHLTEDRPFHRALDDAYYTGRVMSEMDFYSMMEYVSVDYYQPPLTEEEEIYLEFPEYAKFVSREHEGRDFGGTACGGDGLLQMPPDLAEKDPLVFLKPEILLLSGGLPGARLYEGKDPDEEVGGRLVLCC